MAIRLLTPSTRDPASTKPAEADTGFDDRAVARGLEVFQSTMPPELPTEASESQALRVLMCAGTLKFAMQLRDLLGEATTVDWDASASRGSVGGLMKLAAQIDVGRERVVVMIDGRWVDDVALEQWHKAFPLIPVVLVSREDGMSTLRAVAACVARGVVDAHTEPEEVARTLDSVSRGELTMPPHLVPYLYACMLAQTASIRALGDETPPPVSDVLALRSLDMLADSLTPRELAAIELARLGNTNKQIARSLGISDNTVKKHLSNAFDKLGIQRRRQLF